MRHFSIIALVLALAAPAQAQLPDFTYNAFSASFTRTDLDDVTDDADSFTVAGSYEISDTLHLWGRSTERRSTRPSSSHSSSPTSSTCRASRPKAGRWGSPPVRAFTAT